MAALTESLEVLEKDGVIHAAPCAVDIIYRGAIVMHNAAGFLAPAASGNGSFFAGIAEEKVDNSAGSAGDLVCKYKRDGVYLLTGSSFAQSDIGEKIYATDDQTISKTASTNVLVGQCVEFVSSTQLWIRLERNSVVSAT